MSHTTDEPQLIPGPSSERMGIPLRTLLASIALIVLLALSLAWNIREWVISRADDSAQRFMDNIRQAAYDLDSSPEKLGKESRAFIALLNVNGPVQLPQPFSAVEVPSGLIIRYLFTTGKGAKRILLLSVYHEWGRQELRWFDLPGYRQEQIVSQDQVISQARSQRDE